MSKYIFLVQETRWGRTLLAASSALKVEPLLVQGVRVEVWADGQKIDTIYNYSRKKLADYKPPVLPPNSEDSVLRLLDRERPGLTSQQFRTLRGQVLAGNVEAALLGLQKIKRRARNGRREK